MKRGAALLLILLAGCVSLPETQTVAPRTFESPLYLPLVERQLNKLGISGATLEQARTLGASWRYSWWYRCEDAADVECVPMVRDASMVGKPVAGGTWLMGFNEPDLCPAQACLTPEEAAVLWRQVERANPGRKLVAPAPSHLHPEWLVEWRQAYIENYGKAPRIDALDMHCYLSAIECIERAKWYEDLAQRWGVREGWLTEFTYTQARADWREQIEVLTTYLEQSDFWTRYSPFLAYDDCANIYWNCERSGDPSLFTRDGELTEIGQAYQRTPQ